MHLPFLIPLTTCLIAGYLFKSSADEMAYLTGTVTIVSFVLSLILAPWQIQLLVLTLVIISSKHLLRQNNYWIQAIHHKQQLKDRE